MVPIATGFAALITREAWSHENRPHGECGLAHSFAAQGGKPVSWLASGNFGNRSDPSGNQFGSHKRVVADHGLFVRATL